MLHAFVRAKAGRENRPGLHCEWHPKIQTDEKKRHVQKIYPTALAQPAPSKEENAAERGITCLHAGGLEKKVNNALLFFYSFFPTKLLCVFLPMHTDRQGDLHDVFLSRKASKHACDYQGITSPAQPGQSPNP